MQQDVNRKVQLVLPWPPSINHYWRRNGARYFISSAGIAYRKLMEIECADIKGAFTKEDRLALEVFAHPPDKRRRDIDNILKCLCDGLQHAGVYEDDCQIDDIHISRAKTHGGIVLVEISVIQPL